MFYANLAVYLQDMCVEKSERVDSANSAIETILSRNQSKTEY